MLLCESYMQDIEYISHVYNILQVSYSNNNTKLLLFMQDIEYISHIYNILHIHARH